MRGRATAKTPALTRHSEEKLYIGEAVTSTIFGIIIGPYAGGLWVASTLNNYSNTNRSVDPRKFGGENGNNADDEEVNELILEVTRIVLALGVFAIGEVSCHCTG